MGSYEGDVYLSGVRSLPDEGTPRLVALSALYDGVPTAQKNMDGLLVAVNLPEGIKKAEISVLPDGVRHTSNEQREQDVIWSPLIFGFDSLRGVDRMPYELLLQDGLGRTIDTAAGVLEREGDG